MQSPSITNTAALTHAKQVMAYLNRKYLERRDIIQYAMVSMIAGEHVLLLGPPGAAKSAIINDLCKMIDGANLFQYLLNTHTSVDELLGPFDQREAQYGRFKRLTQHKLPEARIAFLDEILHATGETLNSLLELLNERTYIQQGQKVKAPLISVFGATNEDMTKEGPQALYDRFLLRLQISYLQDEANFRSFLTDRVDRSNDEYLLVPLQISELMQLRGAASHVSIPETMIDCIVEIRHECKAKGIYPSDRRFKQSLKLLQVAALLDGRSQIERNDLQLYQHILWSDEHERKIVTDIISHFIKSESVVTVDAKSNETYTS